MPLRHESRAVRHVLTVVSGLSAGPEAAGLAVHPSGNLRGSDGGTSLACVRTLPLKYRLSSQAAPLATKAVMLFPMHIFGGGVEVQLGRQYDVAPDGRFLMNRELDTATTPITLIQNWTPEAKKSLRRNSSWVVGQDLPMFAGASRASGPENQ